MKMNSKILTLAALLVAAVTAPICARAATLPDHTVGKADAPVTIIEYASLTCSHCADFYNKVMPALEKKYIETGKVRFIYRDFPLDRYGLRAAALAKCMPEAQYYPFVKVLFNNQASWIRATKPEDTLLQYATMAGLPLDKAKTCIEDTKMMDALVAQSTEAKEKYDISATPTFIINDGEDKLIGMGTVEEFSTAIDKALAKKK